MAGEGVLDHRDGHGDDEHGCGVGQGPRPARVPSAGHPVTSRRWRRSRPGPAPRPGLASAGTRMTARVASTATAPAPRSWAAADSRSWPRTRPAPTSRADAGEPVREGQPHRDTPDDADDREVAGFRLGQGDGRREQADGDVERHRQRLFAQFDAVVDDRGRLGVLIRHDAASTEAWAVYSVPEALEHPGVSHRRGFSGLRIE